MDANYLLPIVFSCKKNQADIEINSFNNLIKEFPDVLKKEFKQRMSYTYPTPFNGIVKIEYGYSYDQVMFEKCHQMHGGVNVPIYPLDAQRSSRTYDVRIYVNIKYWVRFTRNVNGSLVVDNKIKTYHEKKILGSMPCMVKSSLCHLDGMTPQELINIGEDPSDIGGYVRIGGSDKCNVAFKNNSKNYPQYHILKSGKDNVKLKCDFTSKPGDNYEKSTYIVISFTNENAIYFRLTLGKELELYIPFFVIFYLFGVTADKDIIDIIMPDMDENSEIDKNIQKILADALTLNYSKSKVCGIKKSYISDYRFEDLYGPDGNPKKFASDLQMLIATNINENDGGAQSERYIINSKDEKQNEATRARIAQRLNQSILPHIGVTADDQPEKLKFFGTLIKNCCLVDLKIIPPTDRNNYEQQVCNAIGPGIIAATKAIINIVSINPFNKALTNAIQSSPHAKFDDIWKNNHKTNAIGDNLDKSLKVGSGDSVTVSKGTEIRSRLVTVLREIVNPISIIYCINGATPDPNGIGGKNGDSNLDARKVQPSQQGVLCNVQAVEGEKAGQSGQFTLGCTLTSIIDTKSIENMVKKELEPTDRAYEDRSYGIVYVNYKAIGAYPDNFSLRKKYVELRRKGIIDRKTSIVYYPMESNKLIFFTTQGRFTRPYLIVYSNYEERIKNKSVKFRQYIKYTEEHAFKLANGKMKFEDLETEGIIEYISPMENNNIFCCDSYATFVKNINNPFLAYTHLCISEMEYCVNTLTAPFGNHSDTVRTTYQSKLTKQSIGLPIANYADAFYTKFPISYRSYVPIVSTLADRMVSPSGANVLIANYVDSENQEDSMTIRTRTTQCDKFGCNMYNMVSVELDTDQSLRLPDINRTNNIRGTSYEHIGSDGFPKIGTMVKKGMVLISIMKVKDGVETDESVLHKKQIPMRVCGFSSNCNKNGAKIVKVKLSSARELKQGDKTAHRSGNKNIISKIKNDEMVIVCADGRIPDLTFSSHSIPSRMTVNQPMEGHTAEKALRKGHQQDGTMFRNTGVKYLDDPDAQIGNTTCFNPLTGDKIPGKIFCAHGFYQRLTRMVMDNYNAVGTPIIDIRTGQSNKGIANGGGLRLGEMEVNTIWANSAMAMLYEKMYKKGDGKPIVICEICKHIAIVNMDSDNEIYKCPTCEDPIFVEVSSCIASIAFFRYLEQMGIMSEIHTEYPMFEEF